MSDGEEHRSLAGWLSRLRQSWQGAPDWGMFDAAPVEEDAVHPTRALRRFLDALRLVPAPVVLDLGPVIGSNITFFGDQLGCKVHIDDAYGEIERLNREHREAEMPAILSERLRYADGSVDGVLCWDLFDYLPTEGAAALAREVKRIVRPGGLIMVLFSTRRIDHPSHRKYVIVDDGHLRHRRYPASRGARRVWLGRDVQRLFAPLVIDESFLLAHGQRETLVRKPPAQPGG